VTRIDPGVVSLIAELRGHERQAVERLGRWKTVVEERRTVDTSPAARAGFPFISTSQFGIEGFRAIRANAVGELNVGPFHHIGFDLPPIALIIADLLAGSTDRQEPPQGLNVSQRLSEFCNQALSLSLGLLAGGNVPVDAPESRPASCAVVDGYPTRLQHTERSILVEVGIFQHPERARVTLEFLHKGPQPGYFLNRHEIERSLAENLRGCVTEKLLHLGAGVHVSQIGVHFPDPVTRVFD
jgi:hypothetical protein